MYPHDTEIKFFYKTKRYMMGAILRQMFNTKFNVLSITYTIIKSQYDYLFNDDDPDDDWYYFLLVYYCYIIQTL